MKHFLHLKTRLLIALIAPSAVAAPIPQATVSFEDQCTFYASCRSVDRSHEPKVLETSDPSSALPKVPQETYVALHRLTSFIKIHSPLPPLNPHFPVHQLVPDQEDILIHPSDSAQDLLVPTFTASEKWNKDEDLIEIVHLSISDSKDSSESTARPPSKSWSQLSEPIDIVDTTPLFPDSRNPEFIPEDWSLSSVPRRAGYPPLRSRYPNDTSEAHMALFISDTNGVSIFLLFVMVIIVAEVSSSIIASWRRCLDVEESETDYAEECLLAALRKGDDLENQGLEKAEENKNGEFGSEKY